MHWLAAAGLCLPALAGADPQASPAVETPAIDLRALAENVWLHTSWYTYPNGTRFPSNGLIVRDGDELTLVDTAWGELQTVQLLEVITARLALPVTRAVITHYHLDRSAGADVLEAHGVQVYATPLTQRLMIENGQPVADRVFEGMTEAGDTANLGRLEIAFPGAAHSPDNIVVWLPTEGLLFAGCAIRGPAAQSPGNLLSADLKSWLQALEFINEWFSGAELIIPGHGLTGGPELIAHTARLVREASR